MNVATEILNQLGGKRFIVMTGSKNMIDGGNYLSMHLTTNKAKAKYLTIELTESDTYKMTFRGKKGYTFPVVASFENVYCDQLQEIFTKVTGLDTTL